MNTTENVKAIFVHGGAGSIPETLSDEANIEGQMEGLDVIMQVAWTNLMHGMPAIDVVEHVGNALELNEYFNAGFGGSLDLHGNPDFAGCMMEGRTGRFAAVTGLTVTPFAISAAKHLLLNEERPHLIFGGEGANDVARDAGLQIFDSVEPFITDYRKERLQRFLNTRATAKERQGKLILPNELGDTIGIIVYDGSTMVVGSSTGGTTGRVRFRIGDVPTIHAAVTARRKIAACATGHGESIMLKRSAGKAADYAENSYNVPAKAQYAAEAAMHDLTSIGGRGGIIVIQFNPEQDPYRMFGVAHTNDTIMPHAMMSTRLNRPIVRRTMRGQLPSTRNFYDLSWAPRAPEPGPLKSRVEAISR